ncbi:Ger(x)C family spore germination protein [Clostridium gasigenes]|uniref:Ger(x)C family spore germination protein n=1 Tax=Clostridium gasigenes TaxID=94869 RepID=UPI001C0C7C87|nr:Ger(x)C family spore germination protein [Clostridium gasigenes]MBU3108854.1 Ger(x)C family spore germination protein [Clostridium gasigenes]
MKKLIKVFIILLIPLIFTGCFNYQDINKVTFATSVIFDTDDFGNAVVYLDCIKPYRSTNESSDKGRRIIYKGVGKTTLEAIRDISVASSFNINYSQGRAYIFTEKAARGGIKKYLDLINNNQQFQIKPSMFVYYGNVQDLLEITSGDEEYLGLYLNDLSHKNKYNPRAMEENVNEYLNESLMGSNTNILGVIQIRKDVLDKKVEINGGAIMKDNVLIKRIEAKDSLSYNLLINDVKGGTLEMANPQSQDGFITLEILESNTISDIEYDGENIKLIKDIDMRVSIGEAQGNLILDKELLDYIKDNKEEEIKSRLTEVFEKYKTENLDIFNIERLIEIKYPHKVIEKPLSKTKLELNINLMIDGSGTVKNSL